MRILLLCALALVTLGAAAPAGAAPDNRFHASAKPIPPDVRTWMTGRSWRPGCPVSLDDLRLVTVSHWDFTGRVRRGSIVVHRDVAKQVVAAFRRLHALRYPVRKMKLVDAYYRRGDSPRIDKSDWRSIEDDNTSAFNCRAATGSGSWSEHAYGRAIDLNPIENPYVSGGGTSHRESVPFLDRTHGHPAVLKSGSRAVGAFKTQGWGWGGDWSGIKDYQHFSAGGR